MMKDSKGRLLAMIVSLIVLAGNGAGAESGLYVITSDFQTGSTAYLAPGSQTPEIDLLTIHADAEARFYDGRIYVLNRLGQDNILVLDADDLSNPLIQFSVGNGTNPKDIEFAGPDKAYVSRYDSASLLIVNPRDGSELGEIDLSAFADGDGLPEMSSMGIVGSRLYVTCQRLDRDGGWGPVGDSYLVVIDMETDTIVDVDANVDGVQGISLAAINPYSLVVVGSQIVVSGAAGFGDRAGGIEVIDTATNTGGGLVISEADLGGDVATLVMTSTTKGYVIVGDENFVNSIKPFDLASGTVGEALAGHSGGFTPGMAVDGARLIVADSGTFSDPDAAGLLIYDANSGEKLAGPISVGLPPTGITVMGDVVLPTAVLEEASQGLPKASSLGNAYPNPFNAGTQIPFVVQNANARVTLAVFDVLGRKVRTLIDGYRPVGSHMAFWDGRGDDGVMVGNGGYLIGFRSGEGQAISKVLLLK